MEGRVLNERYEVLSEIGRGGAGRVYLAFDRHLQHEAAIKQICKKAGGAAAGLWHETAVLKTMEHAALPIVYDFFSERDNDYMVMEYVRGITLDEYIKENGPLKQHQAILLMRKLFSVIEYLHSFKPPIIYSDLKPANIIIKDDNRIKLIDFGTAFITHSENRHLLCSGTPGFSAPELFIPGNIHHENNDIYSLGAVFHFALTGNAPGMKSLPPGKRQGVRLTKSQLLLTANAVNSNTPYEVGGMHTNRKKRDLALAQLGILCKNRIKYSRGILAVNNNKSQHISNGIKRVIKRCLKENPEKRYQNVNILKEELKNFHFYEISQILKRCFKYILRAVLPLLLTFLGIYVIYIECVNNDIPPYIWYELPFSISFAAGLCLFLAGIYFFLTSLVPRSINVKITKSIALTGKKTIGLWLSLIFSLILFAITHDVYATGVRGLDITGLPVFIRDHEGFKLLIKDGIIYKPYKNIIIEIPINDLPKYNEMTLRITLENADWHFESREFSILLE